MTLRLKQRELVAVGASIAAGCKPCTDYHIKAARAAKLSDDKILQAIKIAISVRQNALEVMEAYGLRHPSEVVDASGDNGGESNRISRLVAVAAAFAVNCTSSLARHLAAAKTLGIADDEIGEVTKIARFIKGMAASHVENMVVVEDHGDKAQPDPSDEGLCELM
jgi:AhpD family alkylhydroperoxidase